MPTASEGSAHLGTPIRGCLDLLISLAFDKSQMYGESVLELVAQAYAISQQQTDPINWDLLSISLLEYNESIELLNGGVTPGE